ncbi:hypothetical protein ONZ60_07415 [Aeromonas salmonicida]|uniref:hypothetical protein n=1 Tax=Aeromonas salmonicida TaxID=645 RepID=UPI000A0F81BD|nr:hypothetical protein [Aeromonas salmonicida]ORJ12002.1 hypothetical protein A7D02_13260 [Aeromonas salmonicida]ORJ17027.1 hypothetical protein A7D03_10590 [Aeromonas salmonicida]WCH32899.1 hypothetical protein ONZ67_07350 [Aeromonas salmonicida]WCH37109.1 hypothetical protein ONZ60_07415 [Aeromonas salmonicida]HDN9511148.1 hypothetical protein [Aeromonas salmonicida]
MAFYPISPRAACHGVRCTLLTLRLSAWAPIPSTRAHSYVERQYARAAVRWFDIHCHLNAISHCRSYRHVYA